MHMHFPDNLRMPYMKTVILKGICDATIVRAEKCWTIDGEQTLTVVSLIEEPEGYPDLTDVISGPSDSERFEQLCEVTGMSFKAGKVDMTHVDPAQFVGKRVRIDMSVQDDGEGLYALHATVHSYRQPTDEKPF